MNTEDLKQVVTVFEQGFERPTAERPAFWQSQFKDDEPLRAELDRMIVADQNASSAGFLESPAWSLAPTASGETAKETHPMVGVVIGGYEIIAPIGAGGMGELFVARDKKLPRKVALKLVKNTLDQQAVARFHDEMRSLCKIEHDNIARLYDGGTDASGRPFMVMEYLREFSTLRDWLRSANGQGLPPDQVKEITRQVCTGLAQAHDKGVVHRDVKPENIMLINDRDGLRVKVIDFGIAIPPAFTTTELSSGVPTHQPSVVSPATPLYMSPEQMADKARKDITTATDIYSLALVIYEMLTGRLAFSNKTERYRGNMSPPVSQLRPALGGNIDMVLKRAFSENPAQRQPGIRTLAQEVIEALSVQPATVREIIAPSPLPKTESVTQQSEDTQARIRHSMPTVLDTRPMPMMPTTIAPTITPAVAATPEQNRWLLPGLGIGALLLLSAFVVTQLMKTQPPATVSPQPSAAVTETATASPVNRMSLALWRNQASVPLSSNTVFQNGDLLKFKMTFAQTGYVYVLNHDSQGVLQVLYPHQSINKGTHQVIANQAFDFPPTGSGARDGLQLDEQSGTETLYVLFASEAEKGNALLVPLREAVQRNGNARQYATLDQNKLKDWFNQIRERATATDQTTRGEANGSVTLNGNGVLVKAIRLQHRP